MLLNLDKWEAQCVGGVSVAGLLSQAKELRGFWLPEYLCWNSLGNFVLWNSLPLWTWLGNNSKPRELTGRWGEEMSLKSAGRDVGRSWQKRPFQFLLSITFTSKAKENYLRWAFLIGPTYHQDPRWWNLREQVGCAIFKITFRNDFIGQILNTRGADIYYSTVVKYQHRITSDIQPKVYIAENRDMGERFDINR